MPESFPLLLTKSLADPTVDEVRSQPTPRPWITAALTPKEEPMSQDSVIKSAFAETGPRAAIRAAIEPLERKVARLEKAVKAGDAGGWELREARRELGSMRMVLAENGRAGKSGRDLPPGVTKLFDGSTSPAGPLGSDPAVGGI
ncbi:MAG TPA: hypothetical protein VNF71_07045 [Acidimicrobiales bacterium]|nr:hypothetical protein [Acidimicrobiales bacterium]